LDTSIFTDKNQAPDNDDLKKSLATTFEYWKTIRNYVLKKCPKATEEWNFANKFGWSFLIKDNKRTIVYLLPRDEFFKAAMVFGQKAYEEILNSRISDMIKKELQSAKVYAEGHGVRIKVLDGQLLPDIKKIIDIKLKY
jgi:hypothetical protein